MIALVRLTAPLDAASPARLRQVCGAKPGNACKWMLDLTHNRVLSKMADVAGTRLVSIVLIWVFAVIVNRLVRLAIKRVARRVGGVSTSGPMQRVRARTPSILLSHGEVGLRSAARAATTAAVLRSLSSVVIYGLAVLYTFGVVGVQLAPLLAGAGVAGVALGFGAQSLVRDFLSGIFMLLEDQLGVGDVVDVGSTVGGAGNQGVAGTVEAVTLRITVIRDDEGTVWHVPNGQINRVGNRSQANSRADRLIVPGRPNGDGPDGTADGEPAAE